MGRIDFMPTKEGFEEFKKYIEPYLGSGKMKLLITSRGEAILRTRLATRYDAAYIKGLSAEQIKELRQFVGDKIETWDILQFFWDEEVKERREEELL